MHESSEENIDGTMFTGDTQEQQKKDILVTIVLSESTSSLLKLDIPNIEDLKPRANNSSIYSVKPETSRKNNFQKPVELEDTEFDNLSTEVAYFPRNQLLESTSSFSIMESYSQSSRLKQQLFPMNVIARPLLSARSLAHNNCIESQDNNIYVSLVENKLQASSSDWINVCRICHGGESAGDLLSPCKCRGSIALAHLQCLERWLKESATSHCELCRHHYKIIRQPKYGVLKSIFVFLQCPGEHTWDIICDTFGFILYTTATVVSTYMLSILCESITRSSTAKQVPKQIMAFSAVLGIATIDFTYSSWLLTNLEKHTTAWRSWYRNNSDLKVILSESKHRLDYEVEIMDTDLD